MRMVLTHDFAYDAGALTRSPSRSQTHLLHRVQNAAMHWLQSVANVRQSAADNHRQRIVEIRPLHLLFNIDGLHVEGARRLSVASRRRSEWELRILIVSHESQFSVLGEIRWRDGRLARPRSDSRPRLSSGAKLRPLCLTKMPLSSCIYRHYMAGFTKELYHVRSRPGAGDRCLFRLCRAFAFGRRRVCFWTAQRFTVLSKAPNSDGFQPLQFRRATLAATSAA